jgi:hypothetical protein
MARHFEAGKSVEEAVAATREAFPSATIDELKHACLVGRDEVAMWQHTVSEDVAEIFTIIARCEPDARIEAALKQAKRRAGTMFPTEPDKRGHEPGRRRSRS